MRANDARHFRLVGFAEGVDFTEQQRDLVRSGAARRARAGDGLRRTVAAGAIAR
jgi:hypothetical protein